MKDYYSYTETQELVCNFEALLNRHGISIPPSSNLENVCLNSIKLLDNFKKPKTLKPRDNIRLALRQYIGLNDLMSKVISIEAHPDFHELIPHLKMLTDCSFLLNDTNHINDQDGNKIVELYISILCMSLGNNVKLDNPKRSKGNNPDVLVDIDNVTWGFACKTMHTPQPHTIFDSIEKAVNQIEKSPAQIGIPIINLKNIFDHDRLFPIINEEAFKKGEVPLWGSFVNIYEPNIIITQFFDKVQSDLVTNAGIKAITEIFKGKKSLPGILLLLQTMSSILDVSSNRPVPTRLQRFALISFDCMTVNAHVFEKMNHQMQTPL